MLLITESSGSLRQGVAFIIMLLLLFAALPGSAKLSESKSEGSKQIAELAQASKPYDTASLPQTVALEGNKPHDEVTTKGDNSTKSENKNSAPASSKGSCEQSAHVIYQRGVEVNVGTNCEDLVPTDDVALARKQVAAYPDSPEASFILAVALTRTSYVEEALKEVRRARKLAEAKGGVTYFDKMISSYEEMLHNYPDENRVRYGLAWAYYMKAYLLAEQSRKIQRWKESNAQAPVQMTSKFVKQPAKPQSVWDMAAQAVSPDTDKRPHIKSALEGADPTLRPQIKKYYEKALTKLDELLAQKPDDIWAKVYRAFLAAEYTGNLNDAMSVWRRCAEQASENPAPYFFLGEGYLRQGNLKECFSNVSRAIALRALGK